LEQAFSVFLEAVIAKSVILRLIFVQSDYLQTVRVFLKNIAPLSKQNISEK